MKQIAIITMFFLVKLIPAQIDQTEMVISKIDAFDQFTLWNNHQIRMMGYTQLISTPIDIPSPTLTFNSGDSVRLDMWNLSQGPPHTIHLHGLDVNQANDGVPNFSQSIPHDDTGSYYFKAPHPGTYIYHCHVMSPIHVQAGMYGMIIVKPADGSNYTWDNGYAYDSEIAWMTSEIDTNWHHDSIIMHDYMNNASTQVFPVYQPQYFMVNGRTETQLDNGDHPIEKTVNEKVFFRTANIGNLGNRIIFPSGLNAQTVCSDGRPFPTVETSDTLEVLPGERYGTLFEANAEFIDSIKIEYFNLNTLEVENTQFVSVTIEGFYDVEEILPSFSIYPNPTIGLVNLEVFLKKAEELTLSVYNLQGKMLLSSSYKANLGQNILDLDLTKIPNGSYLIQIDGVNTHFKNELLIKNN